MVNLTIFLALLAAGIIIWFTYFITNKAYSRQWDKIEPEDKNYPGFK